MDVNIHKVFFKVLKQNDELIKTHLLHFGHVTQLRVNTTFIFIW